jgi:hypothetical protein
MARGGHPHLDPAQRRFKMKKKRTYNLRRIKVDYPYHVHEIADLLPVHKGAVLRWVGQGLQLIDKRKPYMIHGSALIAFLGERQSSRKQKCKPDEFYCCKCRAPRKAWENLADIKIKNKTKLLIVGICVACDTPVNRLGAVQKLAEYQKIFLGQTIHKEHIKEPSSPIVNSDMREDV